MYTALQVDEFGIAIPAFSAFSTATDADGTLDNLGTTCGDWMSSSSQVVKTGMEEGTTNAWTSGADGDCATSQHLICMETLAGPPLSPFAVPGRVAFVTSVRGSGDLGSWPDAGGNVGIAAGDAICQARATAGGLDDPSTFKAWLSDSITTAIDRFVNDDRWVRPDGVPVAEGKADLTDGVLFAPINVTELGTYLGNWAVWTGTGSSGFSTGSDCAGWTVDTAGTTGTAGSANDLRFWTGPSETACNFGAAQLFCLSDAVASVFTDGFESGDTSAWSSTVP